MILIWIMLSVDICHLLILHFLYFPSVTFVSLLIKEGIRDGPIEDPSSVATKGILKVLILA